ncbi:hypothetical protein JCM8547_003250 [Rhodosporidiobolus lusitaniae]
MRSWQLSLPIVGHALLAFAANNNFASPSVPSFSFFWQTFDDQDKQIPSCAGFQIITLPNNQSASPPVLPLYVTAAAAGYEPQTVQIPEDVSVGDQFTWSAAFDSGTKLTLAMTDSANNSGGTVDGYTIAPGYSNCTTYNSTSDYFDPIGFSVYPEDRPCDEIILDVGGGVKPYTASVIASNGVYANLTDVDFNRIKLNNVIPAGTTFHLFVTDSTGATSGISDTITSALNLAGCNAATPPDTDDPTPVGAIAGGVVGGVVAAALLALLAWWWIRRRRAKEQEEYRRAGPIPTTSEFRTADGKAPLVEPFNIPLAASTVGLGAAGAGAAAGRGGEYDDHSPTTAGSGSYDKSLMYPAQPVMAEHYGYPGAVGGPAAAAAAAAAYQRHPSDPSSTLTGTTAGGGAGVAYPGPYDPYVDPHASHSPSSAGNPYASYDSTRSSNLGTVVPTTGSHYEHSVLSSPTEPHPSSLALQQPHPASAQQIPQQAAGRETVDGLAAPDEFEYRLYDSSAAGAGGTWAPSGAGEGGGALPPGARRYS